MYTGDEPKKARKVTLSDVSGDSAFRFHGQHQRNIFIQHLKLCIQLQKMEITDQQV
ncbi:MAG: hypothetical protein ACLUR5_10940 [Eubacterium ventriosum]